MRYPLIEQRLRAMRYRPGKAPRPLQLLALLCALLLLLPLGYLLLRAVELGPSELWRLLSRGRTMAALGRTMALATSAALVSTLIAVPLAWLTARTDLPGRRLWLILSVLPLVFPSFVGGYIIVAALGPRGMLQQLLQGPFGVTRLPEIYGFPGALLALSLFSYPYVLLSVRAALRGLDPALEESALSLGHRRPTLFFRLTLPLLRPAISAGALLVMLYAMSDFGAVSLLQFDSLTRAIYVQYTASLNRGGAAVLALLLVLFMVVVLLVEARLKAGGRYYSQGSGARRRAIIVPLGPWRWPALLFCTLVVLLALGMPLGVLSFWLWRGLRAGNTLRDLWTATGNSLYVSALAAGAALLVGLPLAFLKIRYPSRPHRLIAQIGYVGYALPGIVVALSLVFFGARYVPSLYQTIPLLVLAYVVRFLPQAMGALETALLQLNPRIEEAARALGHSTAAVLTRVTLPLTRGGVSSAAALVFLTTMKELPSTLLLGPTGFDTLATRIWSATGEGFFARAAAPSLVLVLFSALSLLPVLAATKER